MDESILMFPAQNFSPDPQIDPYLRPILYSRYTSMSKRCLLGKRKREGLHDTR